MSSSGITAASGALGQCAVADFAAARAAHEADFADAERREVVVQHEALGGLARLQQFDALLVVLGAERGGDQRLRFAAREERRAVGARQHARLRIVILRISSNVRPSGRRRFFSISSRKMRSFRASKHLAASAFCSSGSVFDGLLLAARRSRE